MFFSQICVNILIVFFCYINILNNVKNLLYILICLELVLLCINLNFVLFSVYLGDVLGQVFFLFIVAVAAAESAVGLAIAVLFFRSRGSAELSQLPVVVN